MVLTIPEMLSACLENKQKYDDLWVCQTFMANSSVIFQLEKIDPPGGHHGLAGSPVSDEKPALIFVYGSGFAFVPHNLKWNPKIHHVQKEHHLPNPVLLYTCSSCAKYITHHPKFQARLAQYRPILMWCTQQ